MLDTREAAMMEANDFQDSLGALPSLEKWDIPLTITHSIFTSWAALNSPINWTTKAKQNKNDKWIFFRSQITWDQALFFFFGFLLLWLEREKNNVWYIPLTSRQPPPNLHNLTSAWPVMLLANKRLPYRNQILARIIYVSFEITFREKKIFKYVHAHNYGASIPKNR